MATENQENDTPLNQEILEEIESKITSYVHWSAQEWAYITALEHYINPSCPRTLSQALEYKLVRSPLGCYLHYLNSGQDMSEETYRAKLELSKAVAAEWDSHPRPPDFVYDGHMDTVKWRNQELLEEVVDAVVISGKAITRKLVLGLMRMIRLTHCHITEMDGSLKKLKTLEGLVLSGNYLGDFRGDLLPDNIHLLELHANFLQKPTRLAASLPERLLYLGLGRNYLNDEFWLNQRLWERLKNLRHLGLADNDIDDVEGLLNQIRSLEHLRSLELQGNPCSVMVSYTKIVQRCLPSLTTLDGVQLIAPKEGQLQDATKEDTTATLQVFVFRVMGVPKPKPKNVKGKMAVLSYQLEAECPLLDSQLRIHETQEVLDRLAGPKPLPPTKSTRKGPKKKRDKAKKKNEKEASKKKKNKKTNKKSAASSKKKGKGVSDLNRQKAEYAKFLADDKEIAGALGFKSGRFKWAQIMTIKEPAIQTIPPEKKKKEKGKKGKHEKEMKKDKSAIGSGKTDKDKPEEKVIKRLVIAKIQIPLEVMRWSDSYLGYAWDIRKPYFALRFPGIKDIQYADDSKKGKKKKKKTKNTATVDEIFPIPKILTCHIGIALKRDNMVDKKLEKKISGKKKK